MTAPAIFEYQNATKRELKQEYKRIAKATGDDQFFTKRELNHLPSVLMDGEEILAFSSGLMDNNTWLITLTSKRVLFLDKGLIYGLEQTSIPVSKVSAVTGKTGLFFGAITIGIGHSEKKITNVLKGTVVPFTNALQEVIDRS